MRGPLASIYTDEVAAADEVKDVIEAMAAVGIEIKLGQVPDDQRPRLASLTAGQIQILKRRKLDILRVLLAKELVAEAEQIRQRWSIPERRTSSLGRRYGDLLFSARALLPPGTDWDSVTYVDYLNQKVCWSHQLAFDKNGKLIEGVSYSDTEAALLLDEFKGNDRGDDADALLMEKEVVA